MSRPSAFLRTGFLASLPLLLLAATWAPLLQVPRQFDPQQFRVNEIRWQVLSEARREELRQKWLTFNAMSDLQREPFVQRMDVLRRMIATLRRILGREPGDAELDRTLADIENEVQAWLVDELHLDATTRGSELDSAVEDEIRVRISDYLDGLVTSGRIEPVESSRILAQEMCLLIRDALRLRASDDQRGGNELTIDEPAGDAGTGGLGESLRRSEREAQQVNRLPSPRGNRDPDGRDVDPARRVMLKLTILADQLRKSGMTSQELRAALMRPFPEFERLVEERLAPR